VTKYYGKTTQCNSHNDNWLTDDGSTRTAVQDDVMNGQQLSVSAPARSVYGDCT